MSIWNKNNSENNIKPVLKVCDFSQLLNRLIGEATKAHAKHHTALLLLSMHCTSKKDHKTSHLTARDYIDDDDVDKGENYHCAKQESQVDQQASQLLLLQTEGDKNFRFMQDQVKITIITNNYDDQIPLSIYNIVIASCSPWLPNSYQMVRDNRPGNNQNIKKTFDVKHKQAKIH